MNAAPRGAMRVVMGVLLLLPPMLLAQVPFHVAPGGQLQLQVAQPSVDVSSPVSASASFDPAVVRPGEKAFYRVNVDATESAVVWPDDLALPEGLKVSTKARGMITQLQINSYRPLTTFLYEIEPLQAGHFTVPEFSVNVMGTMIKIPAASLEVSTNTPPATPRRLRLELSTTNVYLGQPFRARVILPAGPDNQIEALREIQFDGDGLMMDKTAIRMTVAPVIMDGQLKSALTCEITVTPISAGVLTFSAQGFSAGREFMGPVSFQGQVNIAGGMPRYVLLISDPVEVHVRPLPVEGELPGFTGAIGKFFADPPQLSTDRMRVGEPVQLNLTFHGEGELSRLAPPVAPVSHDWQVIADPLPATSFTLIPESDETHATPAIPFSYFDPDSGKYVDLTVPPIPVTVVGEGLPVELTSTDDSGKTNAPLRLSTLAATPGKSVDSLKPLQLRAWFAYLQLVPLAGFLALWQWDRRRRYLEAHPEIVRRNQARRALRRERKQLQKALVAGDAAAFAQHAARAMNIAVAPHFPANPRALVGGDVLAQLDEASRNGLSGETVKRIFAATDGQFAGRPQALPDLPALQTGVDTVLQELEERL